MAEAARNTHATDNGTSVQPQKPISPRQEVVHPAREMSELCTCVYLDIPIDTFRMLEIVFTGGHCK